MSHTTSGSEDITCLKDQVNSSSLEETNSPRKCGGSRSSLKKGPWTSAEDAILIEYVRTYGEGNWNAVWKKSGLSRCGKSCRLRWANHLRPNIKKGAFTSEEERLIIELHSKFGNKWARMSAHLPGRTDNEIKNYWNMRVKRRQHAGLPLYPPDLCLQTLNQSLQVQTTVEFNNHEPHNQGVEENNYEIPDLTFDHFEENQGLVSLPPILPLVSSMLSEDPSPSQNYDLQPSTPRAKRLRSDTFLPDFSFDTNEFAQFDHFLSSMPSSTPPCKLPLGSLELELSSLQQPNPVQPTSLDYIDSFLQAPSPIQAPSAPVLSDCSSPRKSELLDTLLYDAQILNNTMKQSSEKLSTSCIGTPTDKLDSSCMILSQPGWEEFVGPIYPLDNFDPIVCTKRVLPITGASSSQEQEAPKELTGSYVEPEPVEQVACLLNGRKESTESNKSDALLDMGWYEIDECFKDQSNVLYDLSTLLGEEIWSEYEGNMVGTGTTSTLSGEWGCVSSLWNNMS